MKIFIDFEANDLPQVPEIIAIGAWSEDNKSFYTLVKPNFRLTHNITALTGIHQSQVDVAPSIDAAMLAFWTWITTLPNNDEIEYITYGDKDIEYLKCSRDFCKRIDSANIITEIIRSLHHIEKELFAEKPLKLYNVYRKLKGDKTYIHPIDAHNAIIDAYMLKFVYENRKEIAKWTKASGGTPPTFSTQRIQQTK